jgi:hypothetical protein
MALVTSTATSPAPVAPSLGRPRRSPVNLRSVLVGLIGVCFICLLTPYNDYVVANTFFVGNFLPIGLVLFILSLLMVVNAPLWKWAPRQAFDGGELAVILGMMLVSCGIPSSGLMRYLPSHLIAWWYLADSGGGRGPEYRQLLDSLHLPDWIFPAFAGKTASQRGNDPLVTNYWNRVPNIPNTFSGHLWAVPWHAWLMPALTWGICIGALFGALICLTIIVRRQWAENERLPFPLATIYISLIERPEEGKVFNTLFRSPGFWIAAGVVFCIHCINALAVYYPQTWPKIPLNYGMFDVFTAPPWNRIDWYCKTATLYFSIIGITYFLQTKIAFSLWFCIIALQLVKMILPEFNGEWKTSGQTDQMFGGMIPYALMIIWVGRGQWALVIRHMFGRTRANDAQGRYLPYFVAGWGLILCLAVLVGWMMVVGATLIGAIVIVTMMITIYMIVTRIVAETGMTFVQFQVPFTRPWVFLANNLPGSSVVRTSEQNYFLGNAFYWLFGNDMREALPVYSTHAVRVADIEAFPEERNWRRGVWFTGCLALALIVGYVSAGASTLFCQYNHAATLDIAGTSPINPYGLTSSAQGSLDMSADYTPPGTGPKGENHSRWGHFVAGAIIVSFLSFMRLRFEMWPLHPVGYLLVYSYPMMMIWESVFIGWLAKVIVLRIGGSQLYRQGRSFFIGLIIGEAGAAACWMVVSLVRLSLGLPYHAISLLPG